MATHKLNGYIAHLDESEDYLLSDSKFVIINIAMCHCCGLPSWAKGPNMKTSNYRSCIKGTKTCTHRNFLGNQEINIVSAINCRKWDASGIVLPSDTYIWNKSNIVIWGYHCYDLLFSIAPLP